MRHPRRARIHSAPGARGVLGGRAPRPPDMVSQLAEGAEGAGRDLAAAGALVERHLLGTLEGGACLLEEAEEEVVLRARGGFLHAIEGLLVRDGGGALREGALLDDVVDLPQEREGRGLALGQAIE